MYSEGLAVLKNPDNAIKWFRKASKQGHEAAEQNLAELLKQKDEKRRSHYSVPSNSHRSTNG